MKHKKKQFKEMWNSKELLYKINQIKIFTLQSLAQSLAIKDKNQLLSLKLALKKFVQEGFLVLRGNGVYFSVFKKDGLKYGVVGYQSPRYDFSILCERFQINPSFSKKVIHEAQKVAVMKPESLKNRKDYRGLISFTIDGEDAKDLDDALSLQKEGENYRLFVHIADVSFFVKEDSSLDQEAFLRGTSIYLADNVIPMLPKVISNGVCSLSPQEDKLVFTIEVLLSPQGHILNSDFYEGVLCSVKKLTYEGVEEVLNTKQSLEEETKPLVPILLQMQELALVLKKKRITEGSLDFEIPEIKFVCDNKGRPLEAKPFKRLFSHQLIEELMLIANRCVALFLSKHQLGIYRVHEKPDEDKLNHFIKMANLMGFPLKEFKNSQEIQKFLEKINHHPQGFFLNTLLLRSMKQAYYCPENYGHFGLGFSHYTHFTAPIRRYPDLVTHRLIKKILKLQRDGKKILNKNFREHVLTHSSEKERKAVEMERAMQKRKAIHYLKNHINETFKGTVSGVTDFGIYVALDNLGIEGMASQKLFYEFTYNEEFQEYQKGKQVLKIGSRVLVRLISLNLKKEWIDFQWEGFCEI